MAIHTLNRVGFIASQNTRNQTRSLFYWLTIIFNRVDRDRIKEVGPDLACAEWLLRNGAFVRWKNSSELVTDYNALPSKAGDCHIEAVEANDAGISYEGFPHFEGCKHIADIKLESCRYINNRAMPLLSLVQDSLTNLALINCKGIDHDGLHHLKALKNLKMLKIQGLPYVQSKSAIQKELIEALPNCKVDFK